MARTTDWNPGILSNMTAFRNLDQIRELSRENRRVIGRKAVENCEVDLVLETKNAQV